MTQTTLENARKKFFTALPKRIDCTKCQKSRKKEMFGVRLMNGPEVKTKKADPIFRRQSYCNVCRHE
jgi:hypothetical protein